MLCLLGEIETKDATQSFLSTTHSEEQDSRQCSVSRTKAGKLLMSLKRLLLRTRVEPWEHIKGHRATEGQTVPLAKPQTM